MFPMGVGSNLIVRDGGIAGVVVRLGRGFNGIRVEGDRVVAGAAALDAQVARRAAEAGIDLSFLRTIPGAIGGAARMNAGCYGTYTADVFVAARAVTRAGEASTLGPADMGFAYRSTALPEGLVDHRGHARPARAAIPRRWRRGWRSRSPGATPPSRRRTARPGSTFRNPAGFSSTGRAGRRARPEGLEADRGRRHEGRDPGRRADVADARQLPDQRRGGDRRRPGESWRAGAKKGFGINRNNARVGNHAGRRPSGPATSDDPDKADKAAGQKTEAGMSSRTRARIAVLKGGRSAEREVSLVSGRECAAALRQEGFDVVEIDAGPDLASRAAPSSARRRLQRAARPLGRGRLRPGHPRMAAASPTPIPACSPRRSPWTRTRAKAVFAAAGLPVARGHDRRRATRPGAAHPMPPPYVVKPNNEGSSVGVYLVHARARTARRSSPTTCPRR